MKIEPAEAAALAAVLQRDLQAIAALEAHGNHLTQGNLSREQLESLGFTLHNIYNALENSFAQISLTFENHVKDQSKWHRELLEKMFLDIPPLRPAVLASSSRALLADLLGFRHLFRHAYEFTLDDPKLRALWQRWTTDGATVKKSLRAFASELKDLANP